MPDQRFRQLLDAAPDAILQVDEEGRIVLLNRVTEEMFGYPKDELLGKPIEALIPAELRGMHGGHRTRYREQPTTRLMGTGLKLEGLRKDGSRFPVEISLSPASSEEGFHVTAIVRDTTERQLAEKRFRAAQEEYTHKLAETNRELELRSREIKRADRLKSEFLASMSHELRTPLHTIIGFSELLGEEVPGPLNEKQKRFIQHIHKDSMHLLDLINDILDLSKIEAGRLELRPEPFDLFPVVDESIASVQGLADAKTLAIETVLDGPIALYADRLRVKQILVNLLSNAVKFTPDNGRVRVEARMEGGFAVIAVSDTGVGIPREEHEAIFDEFHQVGATAKGVREGTGLGLAITRRLIEAHGGSIRVESEPNGGSCFTCVIPLEGPQRKTST
ncbi:MAG TPA: ATP-binding protein [Bryobacteraceae bacterium]